jgi:pilus assembly protein CpaB
MGKWRAILPIAMAVLIAFFGSIFLYKWLQSQTGTKIIKSEVASVPVCVAAVDLAWGSKLQKEMIKTVPFLKESLPTGYFSDPADLKDRIVISPMIPNEPIVERRLASSDVKMGGVSAVIKPGKRAIAVKGDKVIGISGFIKPSDRVDVLVTLTDPKNKKEITKMVLENILVLATGTEIQENGKNGTAPVDVYTLELTPEECERLSLAAAKGKLQFALRNQMDLEPVVTEGVTISQALDSLRGPAPVVKKTPDQKPRRRYKPRAVSVQVIKGSEVSHQKL